MTITQQRQIATTIADLFQDSKSDYLKMLKAAARRVFRPLQPSDFKDAYLSISQEQGEGLVRLIEQNGVKNIVEFGTSFGISTLFLAQGALITGGKVVTTELIESKALQAIENFKRAGVDDLIEVKIGDAMQTLKNYREPVDLLLLDGWKDLYQPLFMMLEPTFHNSTIIYVDNADMAESRSFLTQVSYDATYQIQYKYQGKVALITVNQ